MQRGSSLSEETSLAELENGWLYEGAALAGVVTMQGSASSDMQSMHLLAAIKE